MDIHWKKILNGFLLFLLLCDVAIGLSRDEKENLKEEARDMFYHAYRAYMENAYPADELMPLSCKGRWRDTEPNRGDIDDAIGNFSLTLVDTLDTLVVLGDLEEFEVAVRQVISDVTFDHDIVVSVFETNIRMVGGLVSAHILAGLLQERMRIMPWYKGELLTMAKDLGYRLLPAFNTTTGIPHPRINLRYGMKSPKLGNTRETCTACAGTMILEFAALSRLTGEPIFEEKAHRAMDVLWQSRHRSSDLVGTVLNIHSGDWVRRDSGVGAGIDSYYEYCLKAYILLGDDKYLDRFNRHYSAVMKYVSQGPLLLDVHMHRPHTNSRNFMDALLAFWPGLQVLKGDIKPAIETHEMLYQVMQRHNFLPEAFTTDFQVHWGQHPLRPEFLESTYLLYKATGDHYYLEAGKKVLRSLQKYARVPCGYAAVKDVRTGGHEDRMDSFVLSETFKYLYLLFADPEDNFLDLDEFIFTTEAHLLPLSLARLSNITAVPMPEGQTEDMYNDEDVEFARSCPSTQYLFPGDHQFPESIRKPLRNLVDGVCPSRKSIRRKLRASEFQAGNSDHMKLVKDMGITIVALPDGRVQLLHTFANAKTPEDADEGLLFMQEMIELSKSQAAQPENPPRVVYFACPEAASDDIVVLSGGPAQFGMDLRENKKVTGQVAVADPVRLCKEPNNSKDLKGKIAIMERGDCMFIDKARRVQKVGAIGGIVIDNNPDTSAASSPMFAMSGDGINDVDIPLVFIFSDDSKLLLDAFKKKQDLEVTLAETSSIKVKEEDDSQTEDHHQEKGDKTLARTCSRDAYIAWSLHLNHDPMHHTVDAEVFNMLFTPPVCRKPEGSDSCKAKCDGPVTNNKGNKEKKDPQDAAGSEAVDDDDDEFNIIGNYMLLGIQLQDADEDSDDKNVHLGSDINAVERDLAHDMSHIGDVLSVVASMTARKTAEYTDEADAINSLLEDLQAKTSDGLQDTVVLTQNPHPDPKNPGEPRVDMDANLTNEEEKDEDPMEKLKSPVHQYLENMKSKETQSSSSGPETIVIRMGENGEIQAETIRTVEREDGTKTVIKVVEKIKDGEVTSESLGKGEVMEITEELAQNEKELIVAREESITNKEAPLKTYSADLSKVISVINQFSQSDKDLSSHVGKSVEFGDTVDSSISSARNKQETDTSEDFQTLLTHASTVLKQKALTNPDILKKLLKVPFKDVVQILSESTNNGKSIPESYDILFDKIDMLEKKNKLENAVTVSDMRKKALSVENIRKAIEGQQNGIYETVAEGIVQNVLSEKSKNSNKDKNTLLSDVVAALLEDLMNEKGFDLNTVLEDLISKSGLHLPDILSEEALEKVLDEYMEKAKGSNIHSLLNNVVNAFAEGQVKTLLPSQFKKHPRLMQSIMKNLGTVGDYRTTVEKFKSPEEDERNFQDVLQYVANNLDQMAQRIENTISEIKSGYRPTTDETISKASTYEDDIMKLADFPSGYREDTDTSFEAKLKEIVDRIPQKMKQKEKYLPEETDFQHSSPELSSEHSVLQQKEDKTEDVSDSVITPQGPTDTGAHEEL